MVAAGERDVRERREGGMIIGTKEDGIDGFVPSEPTSK